MKKLTGVVVAAVLFFASQASALLYTFDRTNIDLTGGPWATVSLTDTTYKGYDAVHFVVDPLESTFTGLNNFRLQNFYFNENTGLPNFLDMVTVEFLQPTDWKVSYEPSKGNGGVGPFGKFELLYDGKSPANPLEFYLYSVAANFDIQAIQFAVTGSDTEYMFAGHIAGFTTDLVDENGKPVTSGQFASSGTPVPEPGTMMLLGAGFLGLAIFSKRRKSA